MLAGGDRVTVLDVRTASDREEWSIPGSLHIDAYDALKAGEALALTGRELPRDVPVVTVCNAGATSQIAMQQLRDHGYLARSLEGGMKAWSLAWNTAELSFPERSATGIQVRRTGKGCLSYIVGNSREALVIDASLDPGVYIDLARNRGWTISHVVDTHIHADHLSSSVAVAGQTGAVHHLPVQERASFPFSPLLDGDAIRIGDATLRAVAAPGHTLESMVFVLDEHALFTGDTMFLSGVGRPDLEASADETRVRARLLYHSLQRVVAMSPQLVVLPGHTDRPVPFDGRPISMKLGDVATRVEAVKLPEEEFVAFLLKRIPPAPPNHATIVSLNEAGAMSETDRTDLEAGANRCAVS